VLNAGKRKGAVALICEIVQLPMTKSWQEGTAIYHLVPSIAADDSIERFVLAISLRLQAALGLANHFLVAAFWKFDRS